MKLIEKQTWLRVVKKLYCYPIVTFQYEVKPSWFYYVMDLKSGCAIITQGGKPYDTYEKAFEEGIKKTLSYIKNDR